MSTYPTSGSYDGNYLQWKAWGGNQFGLLTKSERRYFAAEIDRLRAPLPNNAVVLEIGFGNGNFLSFAHQSGWQTVGTEVNPELITVAKSAGFDVVLADDLRGFTSDRFDLICAFDVLEHIPQETLPEFLQEVRRVLKPGACFLARFPNGDSPLGLPNQNGDVSHVTALGSGKIRYLAGRSGLELVVIGGQAEPIFGTSWLLCLHRMVTWPAKRLINGFVNAVFFPRAGLDFVAQNLTAILRRT